MVTGFVRPITARSAHALFASRFRRFDREWFRGKPLHFRLMFGSAVRATKAQHIGPDTGQGGVVDVKLQINRLSGLTAPTSETTHPVARQPRFIGNTTDADAKPVGNERADIVGGKDCFDSRCLFSRCQTSDAHGKPPDALNALSSKSGNPLGSGAFFRNC
jgi:hypothetical protein